MPWELALKVTDLQASCEFYEKAGFIKRWAGMRGNHRIVCLVRHSDLPICLSETWGTEQVVVRAPSRDVDELYEALIAARIPVAEPPATQQTGERELCLVDPDGHTMIAWTNTV